MPNFRSQCQLSVSSWYDEMMSVSSRFTFNLALTLSSLYVGGLFCCDACVNIAEQKYNRRVGGGDGNPLICYNYNLTPKTYISLLKMVFLRNLSHSDLTEGGKSRINRIVTFF